MYRICKIMTYTDTSLIQEELLARIDEKMKRLNSMRPIPADALRRLQEEMRLVHTYHSNAIEGNTVATPANELAGI